MTDDQIKYMVERFLQWRLPENFSPDCGISFQADYNNLTAHPARHEPRGTNLFDFTQAREMVRFMVDGMDAAANARAEAAESALEKMREAAAIALPILERDRQSLLECCSKLIIEPDGKISVVPDTLDPDAAEDIAAYDDAISRLRDALTTQGGGE